eukprot:TRINITY_DN37558_c0_g1_i1.p1 TRINITY_DN37558_c0_g1~~TRINITY_DN37558_c0_g1_i1.p1  ORF type:complete len:737 (+),score=108.51 TRINITY_DN37558_c0_g1_i1:45-2255(+)
MPDSSISYLPLGDGNKELSPSAANKSQFLESLCKFIPIVEWLPAYQWREHGMKDIAGGITLGFILVAQSLAHADLCKVSLINGPYSCIAPPLLYSLFGTCVHSSVGTGGLVSLLTGEQLVRYGDLEERTRASAIFTLLVGLVITLMGVFRLAFLVRFLSKPALSGFITASAVLIMVSQFKPMLGLPKADTGGIFDIAVFHPGEFSDFSPATVMLSICSVVYLKGIRKLKSYHWTLRLLGDFKELTWLAIAALFVSWQSPALRIDVVGDVPSGLPSLAWPLHGKRDLELAQEMLPGALVVALVTFLSSFAGAKKFAMKAGYQVIAMNELLALGIANMGGALYGAVPTQIGLSRMGIAYSTGVKSQLGANIYVAVVVAAVLQLFSPCLYFVPRCVLNVIILIGSSHLTEFRHMLWLWSLRSTRTRQRTYLVDFAVWWVAFLFTLLFGAFRGILSALGVSLLLILYQVADPPISTLGYSEDRKRWLNVKAHKEVLQRDGILAFRLEGPLFYANIERLEEWLAEEEVRAGAAGRPLKALVLSAAAIPFVDTTALESLKQLIAAYQKRNVAFLVANASGQPQKILQHVLGDMLPEACLNNPWSTQECVNFFSGSEESRTQPEEIKEAVNNRSDFATARKCPSSPRQGKTPRPLSRMSGWQSMPKLQALAGESSDSDDNLGSPGGEEAPQAKVRPLKRAVAWASNPDLQPSRNRTRAQSLPGVRSPKKSEVKSSLQSLVDVQ